MNPGRVFICARNMADTATITTDGGYEESLPPANLQLSSRGRLWQTDDADEVNLLLTWADTLSERLNFASLWRHNLEPAATWRNRAYSTYDWTGSTLVDTGVVEAYDAATLGELDFGVQPLGQGIFSALMGQRYSLAYFLENEAAVNSHKMTLNDTGNSAGILRASRLYVGRGMELILGAASASFGWMENTQQARGDGGSLRSDGSLSYRELELDVLVDSTQRAEFMDMCRLAGMRNDLFVSVFPGDDDGEMLRDYTFLARFSAMPRLVTTPDDKAAGVYRAKLSFAEI